MMLGDAQRRALAYLKEYGCLREDQLERLLRPTVSYIDMDAIKRQLIYFGLIHAGNGYLSLYGKEPDEIMLKAVDVMLCFPVKEIQLHKIAPEPFILTFFKNSRDGKLYRYDVCRCSCGYERILSVQLEGLNDKYRVILIMLENMDQRENLHIHPDHCFVVREGAEYKFYKPVSLPENGGVCIETE